MITGQTFIILILLSHIAFISTSSINTVTIGMKTFKTDFFIWGSMVTSMSVDGKAVTINPPLEYDNDTLHNVTVDMLTLTNYMEAHIGEYVLPSDRAKMEEISKSLTDMLQTGSYDVDRLSTYEGTLYSIYTRALIQMRKDKATKVNEINGYLREFDTSTLPPKLQYEAESLVEEMKGVKSDLVSYDYGIEYYYKVLEPEADDVINKAEFLMNYPRVYDELKVVKEVYNIMNENGVVPKDLEEYWENRFSPLYVKFIRGLYVEPNVTEVEGIMIKSINGLKSEALKNLEEAKKEMSGKTNPPFFEKGKYERKIKEYYEEVSQINVKEFNNQTVEQVKTLVKVYKESKKLPSAISHAYIRDTFAVIVLMGVLLGVAMGRIKT